MFIYKKQVKTDETHGTPYDKILFISSTYITIESTYLINYNRSTILP